jgi:iron complex outermembrane receptor protein
MPVKTKTSVKWAALFGTASALALALYAHDSFAQTSASATSNAGPTEVVVTATRRSEKDKDVPAADTVISGQKLDILNSSGQDIRFLSARTPGLTIESSFGRTFPRFYIRGLGNTDFDVNSPQPVSVVYDDVVLENPMLKSFPVFDLADVEVLRGPQGTLFGRNTPAGVVKLDSAKPSDVAGGYISVADGTYNTINLEGAYTGQIVKGLDFRLSGLEQHRDDWVTNTDTSGQAPSKLEGYTDRAARLQFSWDDGGPFTALLNIHGRTLDGTPRIFRASLFKPGSNDFNAGFKPDRAALDGVVRQNLSEAGTSLHLNYAFAGLGTLHSITSYETTKVLSDGDIDGGDIYDGSTALNHAAFPDSTGGVTKPQEFSQELRFETVEKHGWRGQFGAYYFHQKLYYSELDFTPAGAVDSDLEHHDTNTNWGVFASAEWKVTDRLTLRGGLRYSSDKNSSRVAGTADCGGACTTVALPASLAVKGSNVSGDLGATYVVTPNLNWYARLATGYQGPQIQDRVNFIFGPTTLEAAKAQTVTSAETGFKGAYFDHSLTLDADVFAYTVKNMQLTAVGGATNTAELINARKVDAYGVELDGTWRPLAQLLITAGGAYDFTRIKQPGLSVGACGGGCTMINPVVAGNALIDGNPLPQAPKWTGNLTARYSWPLADGAQLYAYTDWAYRSEVNYFLYEAKEFTGRSETIGGLRLGYMTPKGLDVAVFVRNLTNQIRAESAIDFNNLTGMINDPRTFGVSVKKAF